MHYNCNHRFAIHLYLVTVIVFAMFLFLWLRECCNNIYCDIVVVVVRCTLYKKEIVVKFFIYSPQFVLESKWKQILIRSDNKFLLLKTTYSCIHTIFDANIGALSLQHNPFCKNSKTNCNVSFCQFRAIWGCITFNGFGSSIYRSVCNPS